MQQEIGPATVKYQLVHLCWDALESWRLLIFHGEDCLSQVFHSEKCAILGPFYLITLTRAGRSFWHYVNLNIVIVMRIAFQSFISCAE